MAAYTHYERDPRVRRQAEALVAAGHEVTCLSIRRGGGGHADENAGSPNPDRGRMKVAAGPPDSPRAVRVLRQRVADRKPDSFAAYLRDYTRFFLGVSIYLWRRGSRFDLVQTHNMPDFLAFAAWPTRRKRIPLLHDVHDIMPHIYADRFADGPRSRLIVGVLRRQLRGAARYATHVLAAEDSMRDVLVAEGIPAEKVTVLLNLPDERFFPPLEEATSELAAAAAATRRGGAAPMPVPPASTASVAGDAAGGTLVPFTLLYHGTLSHRLGLDVALRALALVRREVPEVRFRIVGDGEERSTLVALARELDLEEHVEFSPGYVPVEEIPRHLAEADLGIVPMRDVGATRTMLPTKLIEYVQVGLPAICTETALIRRYFSERAVRFVPSEDVVSLARAIVDLARDPEARRALVEGGEEFRRAHSWQAQSQTYVGLVERLVVEHPGR